MATLNELFETYVNDNYSGVMSQAAIVKAYELLLGLTGDFPAKNERVKYWVDQELSVSEFVDAFLAAAARLSEANAAAWGEKTEERAEVVAAAQNAAASAVTMDDIGSQVAAVRSSYEEQSFTLTSGVDVAADFTGGKGDDTFRADFDIEAAAGTGVHTLGALDSIDGGEGQDTLAITHDDTSDFSMKNADIANIETITFETAQDLTADLSGSNVTGLESVSVTQAVDVDLTVDGDTDVSVSGVTGTTDITGGNSVVVDQALMDDVTVTDAKDVTVTLTDSASTSGVDVVSATGAVTVTATGEDADGANATLAGISVSGGTTISVTQIATGDTTDAETDTSANTHTLGDVDIDAGDDTTEITIVQDDQVSAVNYQEAVTGVQGTKTVKFVAMDEGESTTVDGLTFTASKALTAAEVAAAFANIAASDTQSVTGAVGNGVYTGSASANWTTGAADGASVVYTEVTAGAAPALVVNDTTATGTVAVTVATTGTTAVSGVAGVLGVANGFVDIDDNTTASVTTVTVDGYSNDADIGTNTSLDALETLTLKNSGAGQATVGTTSTVLTLNVDDVDAAVDLDDAGTEVTELTINSSGTASSFALTVADLTDLTVNAGAALTLTGFAGSNDLENVTITGDAAVSLGDLSAQTGLVTFDASENTGGLTVSLDADTANVTGGIEAYELSSGDDVVTLTDADVKIAVNLNAGNDQVTLASGTTSLSKAISAGEGEDTLVMDAADANTAAGGTSFETKIDGFEKLELNAMQQGDGALNVNLENMDEIDYVIVNGGDNDALTGTDETAVVTFQDLLSGQSVTVDGVTYTANDDVTAADVAAWFDDQTFTNWTAAAASGDDITFTAVNPGNMTDISVSDADATNAAPSVNVTTPGVTASTGATEVVTVDVDALIAGETTSITHAGGTMTLTATAVTEVATVTAGALTAGQTLEVGGMTLTASAGATAEDVKTAILTGATFGGVDGFTGSLSVFYTVSDAGGDNVDFTSALAGTNTTDITLGGTGAGASSVSIVQGANGNLTAEEVASALAAQADNAAGTAVITGTTLGNFTGTSSGTVVTYTATGSGTQTDITAASTSGTQPTVSVTTDGTADVASATEVADVTFTDLLSGQSITIAGVTVTATDDITGAEVASIFSGETATTDLTGDNTVANATVSGTLTDWTAGAAAGAVVTFTDSTGNRSIADITAPLTKAGSPTDPTVVTTDGGADAATLTISNLADEGTVHLTDNNTSANEVTVEMTDASGSSDTLNVVADAGAADVDSGSVVADDVETINLTASDTDLEETGVRNEVTIEVEGDAVTSIVVDGNADLDLNLNAATDQLTSINASDLTGSLDAYTTGDNAITITGGSGDDTLDASGSDEADILIGGAGNDTLEAGSAITTMTGGEGSDTFMISVASVNLNAASVITDLESGDIVEFNGASSFQSAQVTLDESGNPDLQNYADAAIESIDTAGIDLGWFQYNGNTYIVQDVNNDGGAFAEGTDLIVKVNGLVDLDTGASYNSTSNILEIA